jgi:hypothetical protein
MIPPQLYNKEIVLDDRNIFFTNIPINEIQNNVYTILDKHKDKNGCNYYFNINDNYWSVSLNIDFSQMELEVLYKTSIEIFLYRDSNDNAILSISNNINDYEEWSKLFSDIIRKLKKI